MNEQYKFLDYIAYSVFFLFPLIFLAVETVPFVEFPTRIFIFLLGLFTFWNIWANSGFIGFVKNFPGVIFAGASIMLSMDFYLNQIWPYPYELFGSTILVASAVVCIAGAISTYHWKGQTKFGVVTKAPAKQNFFNNLEMKAKEATKDVGENISA